MKSKSRTKDITFLYKSVIITPNKMKNGLEYISFPTFFD